MLNRCWRLLDFALKVVMALFLFAMMAITFVDVLGRYLFSAPVPGGFEIVQYLMALVVFASLPLTTAADSHLSVSLFAGSARGVAAVVLRIFVRLISTIALGMIAWRMAVQALLLGRSQQISGYLQLPLAPIAWAMAALAALAFIVMLVKLTSAIGGHDHAPPHADLPVRGID